MELCARFNRLMTNGICEHTFTDALARSNLYARMGKNPNEMDAKIYISSQWPHFRRRLGWKKAIWAFCGTHMSMSMEAFWGIPVTKTRIYISSMPHMHTSHQSPKKQQQQILPHIVSFRLALSDWESNTPKWVIFVIFRQWAQWALKVLRLGSLSRCNKCDNDSIESR